MDWEARAEEVRVAPLRGAVLGEAVWFGGQRAEAELGSHGYDRTLPRELVLEGEDWHKKQNCISKGSHMKHPEPMVPTRDIGLHGLYIRYAAHLWFCR